MMIRATNDMERYEYDEQGDVLDVYFGPKRPAWTIELTDHIMFSLDRPAGQAVALSFLDFNELIRPTPLGLRSFPLTGLADLPVAERDVVLKLLTTPPVNAWLDVSAVLNLPDSPFVVTHLQTPSPEVLRLVAASERPTESPDLSPDSLTARYQGLVQSPLSVAELTAAYQTNMPETTPTFTKTVDIHEAQRQLPELVSLVVAGAEVILTEGSTPLVRLVPITESRPARVAGLHPGAIAISDDFDAPLPDEF
ncbi:MAG: hypothetical protein U0401_28560 [Anaerolineae bacterium]